MKRFLPLLLLATSICFPTGSLANTEAQQDEAINFADSEVKRICVANWDNNGDGELSYAEAATVQDLGKVFSENTSIASFDELQYFTGLTHIGEQAFYSCFALSSVLIPENVTTIGEYAFNGCASLSSITIPARVTSIGNVAFQECI